MRKALSLVLGLLVLLTAFSNTASAQSEYYVRIINEDTTSVVNYITSNLGSYSYDVGDGYVTVYAADLLNMLDIFREDLPNQGEIRAKPAGTLIYFSYQAYHLGSIENTLTFTATEAGEVAISVSMYRSLNGGPDLKVYVNGELAFAGSIPAPAKSSSSSGTFSVSPGDVVEVYYKASTDGGDGDIVSAKIYGPLELQGNFDDYNFYSSYTYEVQDAECEVTFNLKDAVTGQSLSDVTVKEGNVTLGTISDGGSLILDGGLQHTLTFEKSGYWSVTKTIDVLSDMSVTVEMYSTTVGFMITAPAEVTTFENTITEVTFTISPFDVSVAYNTYLAISGLSNIIEVKKAGQVITPESGKYYLGDISEDTQISIKFKAGSIGTHSFTVTLTSNDAVMSSTYTTSKQVAYNVIPLPFSVQMPSEWQVGTNELRISESSGQSILITAILKDANGTEVWSDSASLDPYAAHTFNVNVPSEGDYTLELQFNGQTASWDITVNPAISLLTKTITASEGDIATVQVKIKNPSSNTKYYTIVLEGPIIEGNVSKSVSVAPLSEKIVDVSFQVPNELEYDAYDLNVKVYEGDALQYSDIVHLIIESGGFSLPFFGGGSSSSIDSTWLWLGAGVLALFVFVMALRRR